MSSDAPGDDPSAGGGDRYSSSVSYVTGTSLASGELPGHDPNNTSMDTTASEHWETSGEEEPPSSPEKEEPGRGGEAEEDDEEEEEVLETDSDYDDEVLDDDDDDDDDDTYEEVVVEDAEPHEVEEEEEVLVDEHGNEVTEEVVAETEEVLAETEEVEPEPDDAQRVISNLAFMEKREPDAAVVGDASVEPALVAEAPVVAASEPDSPLTGAEAVPSIHPDEDHGDELDAFMDSAQFEPEEPESFDTPEGDEAATAEDDGEAYESLAAVAATVALESSGVHEASDAVDSNANMEALSRDEDDFVHVEHEEVAETEVDEQRLDDYQDVELGGDEGTDDGVETAAKTKSKKPDMIDIILIIAIILVIVILAVTLPFVLRRNKNNDQPTISPSSMVPTAAPSATPVPYSVVGGPFEGPADSYFGFSSSLNADLVAVGAPYSGEGNGSVTTYLDINGWIQNEELEGDQSDQFFGYSVNVRDDYLIVGAPGTFARGSNFAAVGAAYVYQLERDSSLWSQLGTPLQGGAEIESFNETFGASVAISGEALVVVVGAPMRNTGDGGVYTFRYRKANVSDWVSRTSAPLVIEESPTGGQFGSSVAISADGKRIIAGAPEWSGGKGYVQAYEWNDSSKDWSVIFTNKGETNGGRYGASVTFLDFETFAVGEPGALSGKGIIRVYQATKDGRSFQQLGPDIEGTGTTDALGSMGTVSGASTSQGSATVIAGTASGTVTRYVYDGSRWIRPFSIVSRLGGAATSIGFGDSGDAFVVGVASGDVASIYDTDGTLAPVISPTPTYAPSLRVPTTPVTSPTVAPSSNVSPGEWKLAAYFAGDKKLGSSVAIATNVMASGDPVSDMVATFQLLSDGTWSAASNLTATEAGSRFGDSLAIDQGALLLAVGAPRTAGAGNASAKTGAVYVYLPGSNGWSQGTEVRGAEDAYSDGEDFGSSIAVSSGGTFLVAGAPFNGADGITNRGRVYVFKGSLGNTEYSYTALDDTLLGTTSGDYFGSAVAISSDGNALFIGAPGGQSGFGYVAAYSFDGSSWGNPVSTLLGSTTDELFGASLAVLADDGSIVAVGAPNFNGGIGAIRVFERQSDGTYAPLGDPIEGSTTAMIGDANSISGSVDNGVPTLLVSSSGGVISTYKFVSGAWIDGMKSIVTGLQGRPTLQGSTALGSFVAGSRNQVVIYSE